MVVMNGRIPTRSNGGDAAVGGKSKQAGISTCRAAAGEGWTFFSVSQRYASPQLRTDRGETAVEGGQPLMAAAPAAARAWVHASLSAPRVSITESDTWESSTWFLCHSHRAWVAFCGAGWRQAGAVSWRPAGTGAPHTPRRLGVLCMRCRQARRPGSG